MLGKLILLFILVPLADLVLLMVISKYTGVLVTILLVIVSGVVGACLAKQQGGKVGFKIRAQLSQNQMPAGLLTDGAMIMFAAGLLITPGLITDLLGLSLLIPRCRQWYKQRALNWAKSHFQVHVFQMNPHVNGDPDTVDGEVVDRNSPTSAPANTRTVD